MIDKLRALFGMVAVFGFFVYASPSGRSILNSFGEGFLGIRASSTDHTITSGNIAAKGSKTDKDTLIPAVNGTLEWDTNKTELADAEVDDIRLRPQPGLRFPPPQTLNPSTGIALEHTYGAAAPASGAPIGARASVDAEFGSAPVSRAHVYGLEPVQPRPTPRLDFGEPLILNPAGPGTYSDSRGDIYTQAGPHGAVNTRTGLFSPTN